MQLFAEEQNDELEMENSDEQIEQSECENDAESVNSTASGDQIDFSLLNEKIEYCLKLIFDPNEISNREKPRSAYIKKLFSYICKRYDYNEFLVDKFFQLYGFEIMDAIEANENERPLNIRVNYLKTTKQELISKLTKKNVKIEKSTDRGSPSLTITDSPVPIGATTEYLAGLYTIQGAASLYPVIALDPKPNTKVLDLCSAPGGKTCFISAMMKNTGLVYANEVNKERIDSIFGNVHRLGAKNVIICNKDGRKFSDFVTGFDSVLVDAPCSGTGIINKDKSVKSSKNTFMIQQCANKQKELLDNAIKCCKVGGHIVYSTCSVLPDENEGVIFNALQHGKVKIIESGIEAGSEGLTKFRHLRFHPSLKLARRFYPHVDNVDGFFLCKLEKISNANKENSAEKESKYVEEEKIEVNPEKVTLNFMRGNPKKIKKKRVDPRRVQKKKMQLKTRKKDYQKAIENNNKAKK